jgi:tetratricopeptide (TPR) repeat protein
LNELLGGFKAGPRLAPLAGILCLILCARPSLGQISADEQARRLLEDGRAARSQGKHKQALDNFSTIVASFGGTQAVDDALLEMGRIYLEVDRAWDKARETFDQVVQRFPQGDATPGAYYYLGFMAMTRATPPPDLDDALAHFMRVQRLYPRSVWVPKSLYASGLVHRKAGRYRDAIRIQRRVALEYPADDIAPQAQLEIGECLALDGQFQMAMEELQRLRLRYPKSGLVETALNRTTACYRFYGEPRPGFKVDDSFVLSFGDVLKSVRAILSTPAEALWIASDKARAAVEIQGGRIVGTLTVEDPASMALTPDGELIVAARTAVRVGRKDIKTFTIPGKKPGEVEPIDKIAAALRLPTNSFLISDLGQKGILRFDAQGAAQGRFPDAQQREVTRLLLDAEGAILTLDRDEKTVRLYDSAGKVLRSVGPRGQGYELKRPVDIATDFMRNIYVADEELGVLIFSAQGQPLLHISGEPLRRPKALTVAVDGAILVYDDKLERILRYR